MTAAFVDVSIVVGVRRSLSVVVERVARIYVATQQLTEHLVVTVGRLLVPVVPLGRVRVRPRPLLLRFRGGSTCLGRRRVGCDVPIRRGEWVVTPLGQVSPRVVGGDSTRFGTLPPVADRDPTIRGTRVERFSLSGLVQSPPCTMQSRV